MHCMTGWSHNIECFLLFCRPTTTKPFTVACSAEPTVGHFLPRENTEGASVISMRLSHHQRHEISTRHDPPNLAMLYSKCQLTPVLLLRGFSVVFGNKPVRERVRAALEYPRITCDNHYSWFNEIIDGLICSLDSFSIKNTPAHCCPACNSRSHNKTVKRRTL